MGDYREECIERKSVRAGIIEQKPLKTRNNKPRPFTLECRPNRYDPLRIPGDRPKWRRWRDYRSLADAEKAIGILARKYHFYDWRHKPE